MQEAQGNPYLLGQLSVLDARGVEVPCPKCNGFGTRAYANTTGWRGGIGGQAITTATCDECWGTGDKYRKGANLKSPNCVRKEEAK